TGGGTVSLAWAPIVDAISEFTSGVAYDRPGYGWSGPATQPRTLENVSCDLEGLLAAGGVQPPYILVGHSLGGPYIREFARRNPDTVAGMVFVDSSHED